MDVDHTTNLASNDEYDDNDDDRPMFDVCCIHINNRDNDHITNNHSELLMTIDNASDRAMFDVCCRPRPSAAAPAMPYAHTHEAHYVIYIYIYIEREREIFKLMCTT